MKEVGREYSIVRSPDSRVLSLYRFPGSTKALGQSEIRIKPNSKYTEIRVSLPPKNTSALKMKMLNTDSITYRAFPASVGTYYYTRTEGNKIVLYKVQDSYLFQAAHECYPCDYQSSKLKKAESREEYEHRMRSINFKIKSVESEEFRTLPFRNCAQEMEVQEEAHTGGARMRCTVPEKPVDLGQIEETMRNARIVNYSDLLRIFPCESAVKTVLFKMAENVCGRFVLKNSYYEAVLHEMRSTMLDMFRKHGEVPARELGFLGEEEWLASEIADVVEGMYVLRGYVEELDFDAAHIRAAIIGLIRDLLTRSRVLSPAQISQELSIDKDVVCELVQNDRAFFHLSNGSYALNDKTYWLNSMFGILCDRKSFELPELESRLQEDGAKYQHHELVEEVRKYCSGRGNRFFLKVSKE